MIAGTMFRTPEEAALQLELLLLGTITESGPPDGPLAAAPMQDDRAAREIRRLIERVHELAEKGEESIGIIGAVSAPARAQVAVALGAAVAARRPVTLLDADLRAGLLSFDARAYAQEGLVDVIRYGVRSPRVVAPTRVPGLSLLPVGSGTVDLAGTWAADSVELLLRELSRTGDLLIVNGPGEEDLDDAAPFLDRVASWVLVHEIGTSDPESTRRIRDRVGADRLLGVLVLHPGHAAQAASELKREAPRESRLGQPAASEAPVEAEPLSEWIAPAAPLSAPNPPAPKPVATASKAAFAANAPIEETAVIRSSAPTAEHPTEHDVELEFEQPRARRSRIPVILGIGVIAIVAAVVAPRLLAPGGTRDEGSGAPAIDPAEAERTAEELLARMNTMGTQPPSDAATQTPAETPGSTVPETPGSTVPATPGASAESPSTGTPTTPAPVTQQSQLQAPSQPQTQTQTPPQTLSQPQSPPPAAVKPPAPPPVSPPRAAASGEFAVHVSSVHSSVKAEDESKRIRAAGFEVFIRRVDLGAKGTWHRVYVGPYADHGAAEAAAELVRSRGVSDYAQVQRVTPGAVRTP